jgi:hypothetical protein
VDVAQAAKLYAVGCVERIWENLRRRAGYQVQYFAPLNPSDDSRRTCAAIRGAIPGAVLRRVVAATYLQLWWPRFDRPVYVHRKPVWDGENYVNADPGEILPTWAKALDPTHQLRPRDPGLDRGTATLACAVRSRQNRDSPCGTLFGNCRTGALT